MAHVQLVGKDGSVVARADFARQPDVNLGPAAVVFPPPVRVAGGHVFVMDGTGAISEVSPGGVRSVTKIPVPAQAQFTASFGVSADGNHVVAAVRTRGVVGAQHTTDPSYDITPPFALDVYRWDGSGTPRTLLHQDLNQAAAPSAAELTIEGFDGDTVVAATDTYPAIQNDGGAPGHELAGGRLVTLTAAGTVGSDYGGAGCEPYRWFGALVVCGHQRGTITALTVRRGDGTVVLSVDRATDCAVPSADGTRLATRGALYTTGKAAADPLPIDACPLAWVDDGHLLATGGTPLLGATVTPFVLTIGDSTRKPLNVTGAFYGLT